MAVPAVGAAGSEGSIHGPQIYPKLRVSALRGLKTRGRSQSSSRGGNAVEWGLTHNGPVSWEQCEKPHDAAAERKSHSTERRRLRKSFVSIPLDVEIFNSKQSLLMKFCCKP